MDVNIYQKPKHLVLNSLWSSQPMDFKIMTTPFGETYYFNHNLKLKQLRKDEQNTGAIPRYLSS